MSIISWGLWKGHWAHFVKCLFACKIHNFRVIFKNIRLILDSFWSYKMKGLQSFQGLCPLDPYQGPALDLLGGLQHPQTPAVSGNDRWSLHITPLTHCEYSVIIRDMDFFPSFHWRDTNFFGNFCWRDKNFFHGSFSQNTGPVLPINNEQSLRWPDYNVYVNSKPSIQFSCLKANWCKSPAPGTSSFTGQTLGHFLLCKSPGVEHVFWCRSPEVTLTGQSDTCITEAMWIFRLPGKILACLYWRWAW